MPKFHTYMRRLSAISATAVGLTLSVAPSAWAATANTNPTSGTSSTSFQFLTTGMSCPTATSQANGDKLYSFAVDNASVPTTSIGQMTWTQSTTTWSFNGYNSQGILDDSAGNPYINAATQNPTAGQTSGAWGPDTQGPFTYKFLVGTDYASTKAAAQAASDDFYPGTFNVGIACVTPSGTIDGSAFAYVQQTFTDTSTTSPSFNWADNNLGGNAPEFPFAVALPIVGLGVLAGGSFMMRRRRVTLAG
jgi:hypothetical protein